MKQTFIQEIIHRIGDEILCIYEFGSGESERHPRLSDTDLFVVCKQKEVLDTVVQTIEKLESELLHIHHSAQEHFIERHLLGTDSISGIHVIAISHDELSKGKVRGFRLRLLTTFGISKAVFLYDFKHHAVLLFGTDLRDQVPIGSPGIRDRILTFVLSGIVLLFLPLAIGNKSNFKIWCFKATKYYVHCMEVIARIVHRNPALTYKDLDYHLELYETARTYRYEPHRYEENLLGLYARTWFSFLRNLSFIWRGPILREASTS